MDSNMIFDCLSIKIYNIIYNTNTGINTVEYQLMIQLNPNRMSVNTEDMLKNQQMLQGKVLNQKYQVMSCTKKGKYGAFYNAIDLTTVERKLVLIKLIYLQKIRQQNSHDRAQLELKLKLINRQTYFMRKIKHSRVLPLLDHYQSDKYKIIVTQYCDEGTLTQKIKMSYTLTKQRAINIIKQIGSVIESMNIMRQLHAMLSTDCIYLHEGRSYLGDFGINYAMFQNQSTPLMLPPSLRLQDIPFKVDLCAIGVLMYAILGKQETIQDRVQACHYFFSREGTKEFGITPEINCFIENCLKFQMNWSKFRNNQIFKQNVNNLKQYYRQFKEQKKLEHQQLQNLDYFVSNKKMEYLSVLEDEVPTNQFNISIATQNVKQFKQNQSNYVYCRQKQLYLALAKCQYIRKQIIQQMQNLKMFDTENRKIVQILYMLRSRLKIFLSNIKAELKQLKQSQSQQYNKIIQSQYYKLFERQCLICDEQFQKSGDKLTKIQSEIGNIIVDGFRKVFTRSSLKYKNKMMNGIQGIEYKREQHIKWIQDALKGLASTQMSKILQQILCFNQKSYDHSVKNKANHIRLCYRFKIFTDVMNLTVQSLGKRSFQQFVKLKMNQVQFDEKVEEICQKINIKFFSTIETAIYRIVNS